MTTTSGVRVELDIEALLLILLLLAWRFHPDTMLACLVWLKRVCCQQQQDNDVVVSPTASVSVFDDDASADNPHTVQLIKIAIRSGAKYAAVILDYLLHHRQLCDAVVYNEQKGGYDHFLRWLVHNKYVTTDGALLKKSVDTTRLDLNHIYGDADIGSVGGSQFFTPLVLALTRDNPTKRAEVLNALDINTEHSHELDKFYERNTETMRPFERGTIMESVLPQGGVLDIGHPWPQPDAATFNPNVVFDDIEMHEDGADVDDTPVHVQRPSATTNAQDSHWGPLSDTQEHGTLDGMHIQMHSDPEQ